MLMNLRHGIGYSNQQTYLGQSSRSVFICTSHMCSIPPPLRIPFAIQKRNPHISDPLCNVIDNYQIPPMQFRKKNHTSDNPMAVIHKCQIPYAI